MVCSNWRRIYMAFFAAWKQNSKKIRARFDLRLWFNLVLFALVTSLSSKLSDIYAASVSTALVDVAK